MLKQLQHGTERPPIWLSYLTAVLVSCATVALTTHWRGLIEHGRYLFCFSAVIYSAAFGGLGPGIISTIVSLAGITYFLYPPIESITFLFEQSIAALVFGSTSILVSGLVARRRKAQQDILTITNAVPAGIGYIDRDLRYRFGNQSYFMRYGLMPNQLYGKPVQDVLGKETFERALPTIGRVLQGERHSLEITTRDKNNKPFTLLTEFVPAPPVRGVVPGFYVLSIDVTERKRMDEVLQASEEKYRLASDSGQVGIWDWDIQTNRVSWSDKIYEFHGLKKGEFNGTVEEWSKLVHPEDAAFVQAELEKALRDGSPYRVEFRTLRSDRSVHWLAAQAKVMMQDGKPARLIGATIDITERKRTEERLRKTEDRQRRAIAAGKVGLWDWNMVTDTVEWSDHVYATYGLKRGDFDGSVNMFAELTHPDDRDRVMNRLREAIEGKAPYDLEMRILRPDGEVRWIWTTGDFERDPNGKPVSMRGTALDITERKRWEESLSQMNANLEKEVAARLDQLRKQEEELFQVRKLEAIGQLAGGVAHDFNNLMTGILGMTESLHGSFDPDDPRREETDAILKAAQRTSDLTRQLLTFGRRQIIHAQVVDLNEGVEDAAKLLTRLIREDIRLELKLGETVSIKIDPTQLQQVLINLVVNARDAMPSGGTVTIRTRLQDHRAVLTVTDTGTGMTPEVLEHLFEPFYTTKESHKGTGLGLATVYGIVKQNDGDIQVKSARNQGSTFTLMFPIADPADEEKQEAEQKPHSGGGENVLLIEDEEIVRHVVSRKLRDAGYAVKVASNGHEALNLAGQGALDLIVTDVIMPGMNGPEVVKKIREIHPRVGVLYMSGYPEDVIAHSGVLEPGIVFLEKPIVSRLLTEKAREVLDRAKNVHPQG